MRFGPWIRLLARNGWRVAPDRFGLAVSITLISIINTMVRWVQELVLWPVISRMRIEHAPVFIIGHWRSGTTLLHELMMLDTRFTAPSTLQCMCPNHFLLTSWIIKRLSFLLPEKRPMDDMQAGWDRPQEDEFALANLGQPSPYLDIAFPDEPRQFPASLSLAKMEANDRERWKQALQGFLRRVTVQTNKPILVKSPTHTARVRTLIEMFPDAKFIFITRDPLEVFPSTVKLWTALQSSQGLQHTNNKDLAEKIHADFAEMFAAFERDRPLIPDGQFCHVRYEDLVSAPTHVLSMVYDRLSLAGFEGIRPAVETYFADRAEYRPDRYSLDTALSGEIRRRWGPVMAKYGYEMDGNTAGS